MTDSLRFQPTGVKAPHGAKVFEIAWADAQVSKIPHEILRGYCPCAGCQGHSGVIRFVPDGNQDIREIQQVGNYALSFEWGDTHSTGIYTFRFLRHLGDLVVEHGAALPQVLPELPRSG